MEGAPNNKTELDDFERFLAAIKIIEDKYRRNEVRLEDLLYAYDQMQAKFYNKLNPNEEDYSRLYSASITHEGNHYTKFKKVAADTQDLRLEVKREYTLTNLIERIGSSLNREIIDKAYSRIKDPDCTDEEFRLICSELVSKAIESLNFKQAKKIN